MSRTRFIVNPQLELPESQGTPCSKQAQHLTYWVNLKKTPLQFLHRSKTNILKLIAQNLIF